jgi:hypothetical protein
MVDAIDTKPAFLDDVEIRAENGRHVALAGRFEVQRGYRPDAAAANQEDACLRRHY